LQYMSFLYRDHSDSCFVVKTEVDEERERLAGGQKIRGISSGQSTPISTGPKKKISLKDYKNKQTGGPSIKEESGLRREVKANEVNGAGNGDVEDILADADLGSPSQKSAKRSVVFLSRRKTVLMHAALVMKRQMPRLPLLRPAMALL